MTEPIPMPERDILKPHSFDGIQEYDNDLPRWWLAILWLSIIWSVLYIFWYHIAGAPLGEERLRLEIAQVNEERLKHATGPLDEELLRALSRNPERIAKGGELFLKVQCITCHGAEGNSMINGNPGPGANLRDMYWLHGNSMTEVIHILTDGWPDRGMPAQKGLLSDEEIMNLAIFVVDSARRPIPGKAHDPERDLEAAITW